MLKSLGAKSLAGLSAKPQLKPKQIPIARTVRPMQRGTSCFVTWSSGGDDDGDDDDGGDNDDDVDDGGHLHVPSIGDGADTKN